MDHKPPRLLCPWGSPAKDAEVGCHALLQGIFPTQGWNPGLLPLMHLQVGSLPLTPSVKPQVGTWIPLVLPMNHIHLSKETVWLYDISPLMLTNIL